MNCDVMLRDVRSARLDYAQAKKSRHEAATMNEALIHGHTEAVARMQQNALLAIQPAFSHTAAERARRAPQLISHDLWAVAVNAGSHLHPNQRQAIHPHGDDVG